jgi:four helix bundle protein
LRGWGESRCGWRTAIEIEIEIEEGAMGYKSFKEMPVWNEALELAEFVFRLTASLPRNEDYGLTSQLRRSALSISGNIAEAFGRFHVNDKINFYYFSRGSVAETMSHLEYGVRVGYFDANDMQNIQSRLENLYASLNRLVKSLKLQYKPKSKTQPKSQS